MKTPVISINLDKKCSRCGDKGALKSNLCLSCAASLVTGRARRESKAGGRSTVGTEYVEVSEVASMGRRIINEHHPHLTGARVEFVVAEKRDKDGTAQPAFPTEDGFEFGDTKVIKGLNAFLSREPGGEPEDYFCVLVDSYSWHAMGRAEREAHLDHYITRCALHPEKDTPIKRKPDVIEFGEVLKRRGLYRQNLKTFIEIGSEQLRLDLQPETKKSTKKAKTAAAESGH